MSGNLSAIGFDFATPETFQSAMLALAGDSIERLACPPGEYAIWRSRTGAEIWFHLGLFGDPEQARDIEGLTPFFEGESEVALSVFSVRTQPGDNAFEGLLDARLDAGSSDATGHSSSHQQVTFIAVDFAAHAERQVPFTGVVRLTGFAQTLVEPGAPSPPSDHLAGNVPGGPSLGSLPAGFHRPAATAGITTAGAWAAPAASVIVGRLMQRHDLVNEATSGRFEHVLIDTGVAIVDVVAAPGVIDPAIGAGARIGILCSLFGRILD